MGPASHYAKLSRHGPPVRLPAIMECVFMEDGSSETWEDCGYEGVLLVVNDVELAINDVEV